MHLYCVCMHVCFHAFIWADVYVSWQNHWERESIWGGGNRAGVGSRVCDSVCVCVCTCTSLCVCMCSHEYMITFSANWFMAVISFKIFYEFSFFVYERTTDYSFTKISFVFLIYALRQLQSTEMTAQFSFIVLKRVNNVAFCCFGKF